MERASTATATFLFCDLVGSTELLSRLGNEVSEEVRRRYFSVLRDAVRASRGEEVKNLGDGLMVAFRTSAGDAVACAAAMQRGIANLNVEHPDVPLSIRVGIAAGDAALAAEEDDWFGPAVNTAARLCAKAGPDQILVSEVVCQLMGDADNLFRPVGALELKGLPGTVPTVEVAWRPPIRAGHQVPLPALLDVSEGHTFVGRVAERAALEAMWLKAANGDTCCVALVGDPGVGKTRLARGLAWWVHSRGGVVLYGACALSHESPLRPFGDALRWYLALRSEEELEDELGEDAAAIATLVPAVRHRLAPKGRFFVEPLVALAPAVERTLTRAAAQQPILLILDDVHLASSAVVDVVARLISAGLPHLMVALLLREDGPTWSETLRRLSGERLRLRGLSRFDVEELVTSVVPRLPDAWRSELAERIVAYTGGNPQHVSDVVRSLVSAGLVDRGSTSWADVEAQIRVIIDHTCPYRGLAPYGFDDHALFFGRDDVVAVLLGRLNESRLVGVVGGSGSGKSSVVAAGLVPALRRGALQGSDDCPIVLMEPGPTPFAALAEALASLPAVADSPVALERSMRADIGALDRFARRLVSQPAQRLVLIVDQFEELFTLADDLGQQRAFLELLERAACAPAGPVTLVLVLRADFYGQISDRPALAQAMESSQVLVASMSEAELLAAVIEPAFVAGLRLESGLAEAVVRDVAGEAGGLPLLSHAMLETWRRREGRMLTLAGYRDAGGVRGAIAQTAEEVVQTIGPDRLPLLRELFLRLVTPGEATQDVRRRVEMSEMPERLVGLVDPLVEARLVTSGDGFIEMAHEALIREWPRLRAWLEEDREGLRLHRRLTQSASAWQQAGRDSSELLRGSRLAAALEWVAERRPELNDDEVAFLEAGRLGEEDARHKERQRLRRLRGLLTAVAIALIVALGAGSAALVQRARADRNAKRATQNAVTARGETVRAQQATHESDLNRLTAQSKAESDRHLAMLLALEADRLGDNEDSQSALLKALLSEPRLVGVYPVASEVAATQLHGNVLLVALVDGAVRQFDANTAQPMGQTWRLPTGATLLNGRGGTRQLIIREGDGSQRIDLESGRPTGPVIRPGWPPLAAQLSEDDQTLFVAGGTGTTAGTGIGRVAAYDAATGQLRWESTGHTAAVGSSALGLSPDGQKLVTVSIDRSVMIWDAHTGQPLAGPLAGLRAGGVGPPRFSADGKLVAVTSGYPAEVVVFDLTRVARVTEPFAPAGSQMFTAFRPGSHLLAVAGPDGTVTFWNGESGQQTGAPVAPQDVATGIEVFWSPDGKRLIIPGRRRVAAFDPDGIETIGSSIAAATPGSPEWSPDGKLLAFSGLDQQVIVADSRTGRPVIPPFSTGIAPPFAAVPGLRFSPDGTVLAVGGSEGVRLIDATNGGRMGPTLWDPALGYASDIAFNPGGSLVAIGGSGRARVFDVRSGAAQGPLLGTESASPAKVAFGPDAGTLYVNPFLGSFSLYDWSSGKLQSMTPVVATFAYSPSGVLISGDIGGVQGRDPHTLQAIGNPPVFPSASGTQLAVSADGKQIAAAIQSGPIWLARLDDGYVYTPGFPPGRGGRPAFSPDGTRLATSRPEGGLNVWSVDPAVWRQRACDLVGRNLTRAEWRKYLPNGGPYRKTCEQWPLEP